MQCLSSLVLLNDKKSSIQTLPKMIFYASVFRKKLTVFQREMLVRKKKLDIIWSCAVLCSILCFSKYASQEKERKTASCFHEKKREEFSPRAETSYFFEFCQLALEAYYPGVRHKFPKGRENRQGRQSMKKGNIWEFPVHETHQIEKNTFL